MSNPPPDPTSSQFTAGASVASVSSQEQFHESIQAGNLPFALAAGSVAALIGAALWAVITVVTEYQIGFMAVGVGFLVGFAVGKFGGGQSTVFRVTGAVLALFGCVLGNFFTIIGFVSRQEDIGFFAMLAQVDYTAIPGVMASTASPMDFLFYGIAIYEGFKLSVKNGG